MGVYGRVSLGAVLRVIFWEQLLRFFIFISLFGEFSIRGNGGVLSMARIKTSRVCNSVSGVRALHCFN